jgi:DNA-binding NarL/FixJ family response regulator
MVSHRFSSPAQMEACLEFLEAAYQWDVVEEEWLKRLVTLLARVWGNPRWGCAFTYDASDLERFRFSAPITMVASRRLREFLVKGLSSLTPEMLTRQIVASAATGQSTKEIAYELGISHGTVRVLLARACARLGVASRKALLDLHLIRALRGGVSLSYE